MNEEYLKAAASIVAQQAADFPGMPVPVDPLVAEYMGAFDETALSPEDMDEEFLTETNGDD